MSSLSAKSLWTSQGNSSASSISAARASPIFSSTISRTSPRNSSSSSGSAKFDAVVLTARRELYSEFARRRASRLARAADDQGVALAAAAAQGRPTQVHAPPAHLVGEREDQPAPAHADRMAERDRSAVHVDQSLVGAEHPRGVQGHRGERLVDLDEAEV